MVFTFQPLCLQSALEMSSGVTTAGAFQITSSAMAGRSVRTAAMS